MSLIFISEVWLAFVTVNYDHNIFSSDSRKNVVIVSLVSLCHSLSDEYIKETHIVFKTFTFILPWYYLECSVQK